MSKQPTSRARLTLVVGTMLLLLPVLYFLSIGPAILLIQDVETLNNYCYPLNVAIHYSPPLNRFANWYVDFFVSQE